MEIEQNDENYYAILADMLEATVNRGVMGNSGGDYHSALRQEYRRITGREPVLNDDLVDWQQHVRDPAVAA